MLGFDCKFGFVGVLLCLLQRRRGTAKRWMRRAGCRSPVGVGAPTTRFASPSPEGEGGTASAVTDEVSPCGRCSLAARLLIHRRRKLGGPPSLTREGRETACRLPAWFLLYFSVHDDRKVPKERHLGQDPFGLSPSPLSTQRAPLGHKVLALCVKADNEILPRSGSERRPPSFLPRRTGVGEG